MKYTTEEIIEKYKNAAISYGVNTGVNSKKANNQHNIIINCYLQLKELDTLESLQQLLGHENDNVKLWSASHLLAISPELAEMVLYSISKEGGLLSYSAMATLDEWKKGRLSFTYDGYKVKW